MVFKYMRLANRMMATQANRDGLRLTFGTPARLFYKDKKVKQVDVPSYSGSFGILADHVPILSVIKPGVVTVHEEDGSTNKIFVAAGTVTVNEDSSLLVLASEAVALEDLNVDAAQKNLNQANTSNTPEAEIQKEVNQAILECAKMQ